MLYFNYTMGFPSYEEFVQLHKKHKFHSYIGVLYIEGVQTMYNEKTEDNSNKYNCYIENNNIKIYILSPSIMKNKEDYILTHNNTALKKENYTIFYWPTSHLFFLINGFKRCGYFKEILNLNKDGSKIKKLFICLNNRNHYHRYILMDELCKNDLLNDGLLSWNQVWRYVDTDIELDCWTPEFIQYDTFFFNSSYDHKNKICLFHHNETSLKVIKNKAFVWVAGESDYDNEIRFTEKLWQPILIEQPFLILSTKGYYKKLKDLGFELYDEIFNYDFDEIDDVRLRARLLSENLKKIKKFDYRDLFNLVKDKVIKNKKHAFDLYLYDGFLDKNFINLMKENIDDFIRETQNGYLQLPVGNQNKILKDKLKKKI